MRSGITGNARPNVLLVARVLAGASAIVFGFAHFNYIDFTASMVPGWIPYKTFWAWATGAGHLAAGLALVSGFKARLAAGCEAAMMGSFVVLLHLPRVIAAPDSHVEWIMLGVSEHAHRRRAAGEEIRHNRGVNEEEDSKPVEIPHTELAPADAARRRGVVRAARRHGLWRPGVPRRKVADVMRQLERREAIIVYDPGTDSIDIVLVTGSRARA